MLALDIFLFGLPGLIIYAVQMLWIPFWAAGVVNGVGHTGATETSRHRTHRWPKRSKTELAPFF